MPKLSRRREVSQYLLDNWGISRTPATLAKLACVGGGPKFRKDGKFPLYDLSDVDSWVEEILSPAAATTAEHDMWAERNPTKRVVTAGDTVAAGTLKGACGPVKAEAHRDGENRSSRCASTFVRPRRAASAES